MKKWGTWALALMLTITLCLGTVLTASAESVKVGDTTYTYTDEINLLPDDKSKFESYGSARISGSAEDGYVLVDLNGWGANVCDIPEWKNEDGWMLYYDLDVEMGTLGIRAQWWNCNVSKAILAKDGLDGGGDNGDHLLAGKYRGMIPVSDFASDLNTPSESGEIKWLLNLYVVKAKVTVRSLKMVRVTDTQTETPVVTTTTTEKAPEEDTNTTTSAVDGTTTTEKQDAATTTTTAKTTANSTTQTTQSQEETKGGFPVWGILLIAAGVVAVAAVVVFVILKKKK